MARRFFFGGNGADLIEGSDGADVVFAFGGNDTITTGAGRDFVFGGSGNDIIDTGAGNDTVFGGSGNDTILAGTGNDWVYSGSGNDTVDAGAGNDLILAGSGNDDVQGGSGSDHLYGHSGADRIDGGSGNDYVSGGSGNDSLFGGLGTDVLVGGRGDDLIVGGAGADAAYGGSGADLFVLSLDDVPTDGGRDYVDGGSGVDTLVLDLTAEEFARADIAADLLAFLDHLDANTTSSGQVWGPSFDFAALALRVYGVETLRVFVDGVERDPRDAGPSGPEAVAVDDAVAVTEGASVAGDVTSNDTVGDATTVTLVSGVERGTLVLNADGTFTFDAGDDFEALADGQTTTVAFTYQLSGAGEARTATATITVTGTNDAPVVGTPLEAVVAEGAAVTIDLLDGASDIDAGDSLSVTVTSGLPSGAVVDGTTLLFDAADPAYDALAEGETQTISITYDVVDAGGATRAQTATLTVTGTNDAPVVDGPLSGRVTEGGTLALDLLDGASDVDAGDTLGVANLSELPAGVSLDGTTLSVDAANPAFASIAEGRTATFTVTYDVVDAAGAAAPQAVTVTVTGTNDTPRVAAALGTGVTEGATASLNLLAGASDADAGARLSVANLSELPAGVSLDGDMLSLDASDPAYDSLASGQTVDVTVAYDIVDEFGASVAQTATFTVTGANDAPTVAFGLSSEATEDGGLFAIDMLAGARDIDFGAVISVANLPAMLPAGVVRDGDMLVLDASDPAFQSLGAGESMIVTLVINYDIVDEFGASVAQTAAFRVTGTNDAPVVQGSLSANANVGGDAVTVDLLDGASDVDAGDSLSVILPVDLPAGVSVDGSTLSFDAGDPAYDDLGAGDSRELVIAYTVEDGNGGAVSQTLTLIVQGSNAAPTVTTVLSARVAEGTGEARFDLLEGAQDANGDALSVSVSELPAGVALDGTDLVVDADADAFDALGAGESVDVVVAYTISDTFGAEVAQTFTLTVTGTNDAPVLSGAIGAQVTEGSGEGGGEGGGTVTLSMLDGASDVDAGDTLSVANVAVPAGVAFDADALTLSVDAGDAAFDTLADGETRTLTVTYDVVDGEGGVAAQTATFTVTGTNDAPTVAGALSVSGVEDTGTTVLDLLSGASDADTGATLDVANLSGLEAGVTLSGTDLVVDTSDAAFQALAEGQTRDITVTFDVVDEFGASVAQSATVTVTGTNDAPTVAAALSSAAVEGAGSVSLDLLDGASDVDGARLSVANLSELPAGLSLDGTVLSLDADDGVFDALADGEVARISITYDVVDASGASVAQSAVFTVTGTNDAPTVAGALEATVAEDAQAVPVIDLLAGASDADNGATLGVANISGLVDGVSVSGSELSVDASATAFQSLAEGESRIVTVTYDVVDEDGASVAQSVTITITGANDAPTVAAALTASAVEDGASVTLDLLSGATDVDGGAVLAVANLSELPAGVSVDGSTLTLDPTDAAFQSLADGDRLDLTVTYDVVDASGASVAQTATLTVTGTNDAPVVDAAVTGTVSEDAGPGSLDLLTGASDVDAGDTVSVTNLQGLVAGLVFDAATGTVRVDRANDAFDTLGVGESVEVVLTYDVTDASGASVAQTATLTVTGSNDAPVVTGDLAATVLEDAGQVQRFDLLDGASDVDGDTLSVALASALPAGVTLDGTELVVDVAANAGFQALAAGDTADVVVTYDVVDGEGGAATRTFTLTVEGQNDAPVLTGSIEDVAVDSATAFTVTLPDGLFADSDMGDVLTLSAELADGGALPAWLVFDAATGTFSGTPGAGDDADLDLVVTATDGAGESVSASFGISVGGNVITGTDGNDQLVGTGRSERLIGGLGDDVLNGGGGDDTYVFNAGDGRDTVEDNSPSDDFDVVDINGYDFANAGFERVNNTIRIVFEDDSQTLTGDVITLVNQEFATDNIEEIRFDDITLTDAQLEDLLDARLGTFGDDIITGDFLDNQLFGNDGNDTFTGGRGNDSLRGGNGEDTFVFATGDGQDVIVNDGTGPVNGGSDEEASFDVDTVRFTDRSVSDAIITASDFGRDLTISFANGDSVFIADGFDAQFFEEASSVGLFAFTDGVFTLGEVTSAFIATQATSGDDVLTGFRSDDTFAGGAGDDVLEGGIGDDTYIFGASDGSDEVNDTPGNGADTFVFEGRDYADATITRDGDDVVLDFGAGDVVRISAYDRDPEVGFESQDDEDRYVFDDRTVDLDALLSGGEGPQVLVGTPGDETLMGGTGDDVLAGGAGDDVLIGGEGSDTYVFEAGFGSDLIIEELTEGVDVADFTAFDFADASFGRDGNDLVIDVGTDGTLRITDGVLAGFGGGAGDGFAPIDRFVFADRTVFASELFDILNPVTDVVGTDGDDTLTGTDGRDRFDGGAGDDVLEGRDGDDDYVFEAGDGNDTIIETATGGSDDLDLSDFSVSQATFSRSGDDIVIDLDTGDSITIVDGVLFDRDSFDAPIDYIGFSDRGLFFFEILDIVDPVTEISGTDGDDVLVGTDGRDRITGGLGDDVMDGGEGDDTYILFGGPPTGQTDTITDTGSPDDVDTLELNNVFLSDLVVTDNPDGTINVDYSFGDSVNLGEGDIEVVSVFNEFEGSTLLTYQDLLDIRDGVYDPGPGGPGGPGGPIPVGPPPIFIAEPLEDFIDFSGSTDAGSAKAPALSPAGELETVRDVSDADMFEDDMSDGGVLL